MVTCSTRLKIVLAQVQRPATRWILSSQKRETWYKDRLQSLAILPLAYDRELKDLVLFFKLVNGFYDFNLSNFASFVTRGNSRNWSNVFKNSSL